MTNEQKQKRIGAYRECSELIKELYGSDKLDERMELLMLQQGINGEFKDIIGDTILGFHKTSELTELLQKEVGVSADDAQRIFSDLKEFLAPIIAREKGEINPNHEALTDLQETFTPTPSAVQTEVEAETTPTPTPEESPTTPLEPIDSHAAVQAMHTMDSDMSRIHGYGAYRAQFPNEAQEAEHTEEVIRSASQEELLTEKPKLTDMPTYEEGEGK